MKVPVPAVWDLVLKRDPRVKEAFQVLHDLLSGLLFVFQAPLRHVFLQGQNDERVFCAALRERGGERVQELVGGDAEAGKAVKVRDRHGERSLRDPRFSRYGVDGQIPPGVWLHLCKRICRGPLADRAVGGRVHELRRGDGLKRLDGLRPSAGRLLRHGIQTSSSSGGSAHSRAEKRSDSSGRKARRSLSSAFAACRFSSGTRSALQSTGWKKSWQHLQLARLQGCVLVVQVLDARIEQGHKVVQGLDPLLQVLRVHPEHRELRHAADLRDHLQGQVIAL